MLSQLVVAHIYFYDDISLAVKNTKYPKLGVYIYIYIYILKLTLIYIVTTGYKFTVITK